MLAIAHYEGNFSDLQYAKDPLFRAECVQIMALLKACGDPNHNIHPDRTNSSRGDCFSECVNTERFLTEELTERFREPGGAAIGA